MLKFKKIDLDLIVEAFFLKNTIYTFVCTKLEDVNGYVIEGDTKLIVQILARYFAKGKAGYLAAHLALYNYEIEIFEKEHYVVLKNRTALIKKLYMGKVE